jgi:2-dehydropantoate 2-reductase
MRIAIVGAGAMGCLLASYLSPAHDVWLIDNWQAQVDTITAHGLTRERDGVRHHSTPHATTEADAAFPSQVAIVMVKYHQTAWAATQVAQLLATDGICVTLQNGIGGIDILSHHLGADRTTQGVTSLGGTLLEPGQVRHAGMGDTVFAQDITSPYLGAVVDAFNAVGLPAHFSSSIDSLIWGKLIVNVGINALTGILRVTNGVLAEHTGARNMLMACVHEAVQVASAQGITLPYADPVAHVLQVATATAQNRSSTLQDVLRGSPSEISTINGAVVRSGERLGITTPYNRMLWELMQVIDSTAEYRVR